MRNFKFRAWCPQLERMVCNPRPFFKIGVPELYYHNDEGDSCSDGSLMQFTGLKDFNGTEIYEGDIIKKPNGNWGVIVWKAPSFEVTVDEKQSSLYSLEYFEDVEVIGNIHEHPELLTQ